MPFFGVFGQMAGSDLTVHATVQDGVVSGVSAVGASRSQAGTLGQMAESWVKAWQFRPGVSGTIDVVYRHSLREYEQPCSGIHDMRTLVTAELPRFVDVRIPAISTCDPSMTTTRLYAPIKTFTAVVICECAGNKPIANLSWVLKRAGQDKPEKKFKTDRNGRFVLRSLKSGAYVIDIEGNDYYHHQAFEFTVAEGGMDLTTEIRMTPDEPPTYLPVPAWVRGGDIPAYPDEALANDIEGTVKLQVTVSDNQLGKVSASAAPLVLTEAAIANVRTWRLRARKARFTIEYRYRLRSGDCTKDLTTVTMQLPTEVEVVGVRGCRNR